jgi:hypothetical protein
LKLISFNIGFIDNLFEKSMIDLLAEEIANKLVTDRSKLIEVITLAL